MLSKKMLDALNKQVNAEFYAAFIYLSMATYFEEKNLPGFAHWMGQQHKEEVEHAMKIYEYINDRGSRVILKAIEQPPVDFSSPLDVFQKALEHEVKVTGMINNLMDIAEEEKDRATRVFLHWFIEEQVEEEKNASEIIETLKMLGDKGHALIMLDRQLARRGA
ncbi:MAG TPA: ferritin [Acidobacteriota bacterium]|nr:ferritin [Acidobacteriota bacterium]